jgi:fumarylacetoacetate (FAA) hydrolase
MKLASLKTGGRDGALIVVDSALARAALVPRWSTLREAVENWSAAMPDLQAASDGIAGNAASFAFDASLCSAPLPRAFQWLDGSAYLNHAELVRKARSAEMPELLYREPMMYQGAADGLVGAMDPIMVPDENYGIDLEAEIAIVTDDVPMGISIEEAPAHIVLVMLVNDVSLRNLMPEELSKGFGFLNSKPATAFSPVAVTPDELGAAWDGRKLSRPIISRVNDMIIGAPDAGTDLDFDFAQLIAHTARTRTLAAGTIIGSGTVSNRAEAAGVSCIQERRMREKIATGAFQTPHLQFGDRVAITMLDDDGQAIFGTIDQKIEQYVR